MSTFKCAECGFEKNARCKPQKCPQCGEKKSFEKTESKNESPHRVSNPG
ncbi:MAG: RCKP-type rubredoxin-like domain-containing protein [Syntrophobacter sp.]